MSILSVFPKVGGLLGQAFGGFDNPNLSPAENLMARKQALMNAGIGVLGASGPSAQPVGFGQILAQGLNIGQQSGMQARQDIAQQNAMQAKQAQKKQLADMLASGQITPDVVQRMAMQAAAMGDTGTAAALVGLLKEMKPSDAGKPVVMGPGNRYMVDPQTHQVVFDAGAAPETAKAPVFGTPEWYDAKRKELQLSAEFRSSGRSGGGAAKDTTPKPPKLNETQAKAAAFAQFIPDHIQTIENFVGAPSRVQQALSDQGLREFTKNEQQRLKIAGQAITEAWLRLTTGSAYNDTEYKNAYNMFVPQPGDSQGAIDDKKANLSRLQKMLTSLSGQGAGGAAPASWQARASELRSKGLKDAAIIAQLRKEGLIQ